MITILVKSEHEWLTSDEQVSEALIAHDMEFQLDEDGDPII